MIPWLIAVTTAAVTVCAPSGCKDAPGGKYEIAGVTGEARLLPKSGPIRFAVIGDSGKGSPEQHAVAGQLEKADVHFILHTGDIVYPRGAREDYETKYFAPYKKILPRTAVYPTPGNHDYGNHLFRRWLGRGAFEGGYQAVHHKPPYYSFDAGPAHFVSLDVNKAFHIDAASDIGEDSEQGRWLEADLAGSKARWKIVLLHVQVFSSRDHGKHHKLQKWLLPVFKKHGVQVVFQGHSHIYERTKPVDGTTYVTVGTSGAALHERGGEPPEPFAFQLVEHGHAEAEVDGDQLSLRFVDKDGRERDRLVLRR